MVDETLALAGADSKKKKAAGAAAETATKINDWTDYTPVTPCTPEDRVQYSYIDSSLMMTTRRRTTMSLHGPYRISQPILLLSADLVGTLEGFCDKTLMVSQCFFSVDVVNGNKCTLIKMPATHLPRR